MRVTYSTCRGWLLGFYDSTRDKDDTTVGVGHSRRYCNTGYDQSQGRRPSTLKCIGPISKGDIEPNHPSEINPNSDSRSTTTNIVDDEYRRRRIRRRRISSTTTQQPVAVVVGVLRQYPWQRRYDCRSGSLPEILQYRVWPVSRTETFNTQVHWPNLQRRYRAQPSVRN